MRPRGGPWDLTCLAACQVLVQQHILNAAAHVDMGGSPDSQDTDHIIQAPRIQGHRAVVQGVIQHAVVRLVDPVHIGPRVAIGGRAREGELLVLGWATDHGHAVVCCRERNGLRGARC